MSAQTIDTPRTLALGDLGYSTLPEGLTGPETHAYRVGFDRAARRYSKANGGPGVVHDGRTPVRPGGLDQGMRVGAGESGGTTAPHRPTLYPHRDVQGVHAMSAQTETGQLDNDRPPKKKGATTVRHVRIPDATWVDAARNAERDGMTISELVRDLLRDYNAGRRMS